MDASIIGPVLLILLLIAIGVERAVEIIWNYVEWGLLNTSAWQPSDLKSPRYQQFKSGTSLVVGIVFGLLIANFTGMRLFEYLRPLAPEALASLPVVWDVLLTGLILGALTKPLHDLLGIIAQTRNLLANSAIRQREAAGAELAESVLKLAQSDAQMMLDVPGVGPARLSAGENGEEPAETQVAAAERYAEMVRNRIAM